MGRLRLKSNSSPLYSPGDDAEDWWATPEMAKNEIPIGISKGIDLKETPASIADSVVRLAKRSPTTGDPVRDIYAVWMKVGLEIGERMKEAKHENFNFRENQRL